MSNTTTQKSKIDEALSKNYPDYIKNPFYKEFLYESIDKSDNPFEKIRQIEDQLEKGDPGPPIGWQACLAKRKRNIRSKIIFYVRSE